MFSTCCLFKGDALEVDNGKYFSTKDLDLDQIASRHCAQEKEGAWWYNKACSSSNLNGRYVSSNGIVWLNMKIKFSEMKFRSLYW